MQYEEPFRREAKIKAIISLLGEWEEVCAEQSEETFICAMRIQEAKHEGTMSQKYATALLKGEEYLRNFEKKRRKMAERILEAGD